MTIRLHCFSLALLLLPLAAQEQIEVRPRIWTRDRIPVGWVVHETKNYQIQSQCGLEKAKRLGEHMETMNKTYRFMFKPDKEGAKRQPIKLFATQKAFATYGRVPSGAAAYYSSTHAEMVCYDTGKWMDEAPPVPAATGAVTGPKPETGTDEAAAREALERRLRRQSDLWKMDLLGCAAHEGWHQYFHWYVGSLTELPSWINEGMGDYFYTAVPKKVKGKQRPAELGRTFAGRLMIAQAALRTDNFVAVPQLIRYSQAEYYSNPSVCYAEGWSLCQFLLHSGNKDYAKIIPSFIRLVRDDTNMEVVTGKAFKGIDLEKLDTEYRAWLLLQKVSADDDPGEDPIGEGENEGKGGA